MDKIFRCIIALVLILVSPATGSCSDKNLSRSRAADVIKQAQNFSDAMVIKVPVGNIWWDWRNVNDPNPNYPLKTLQDRDILTYRESGQKEGWWNKEYITELTPRGKDLSKSWVLTKEKMPNGSTFMGTQSRCWTVQGRGETCHEPNGDVYSVVLARRKMIAVTGIRTDPGGKESSAEFTWEWVPTADGKIFVERIPTGVQKGRALFELYDDGWRITGIDLTY